MTASMSSRIGGPTIQSSVRSKPPQARAFHPASRKVATQRGLPGSVWAMASKRASAASPGSSLIEDLVCIGLSYRALPRAQVQARKLARPGGGRLSPCADVRGGEHRVGDAPLGVGPRQSGQQGQVADLL